MSKDLVIRPGEARDFCHVVAIQDASAELSAWTAEALEVVLQGGSRYRLAVAELDGDLIGFLMSRELPADEMDILSLAVILAFRRRCVPSALLESAPGARPGPCFLEVRASNAAARRLYRRFGFEESGLRHGYYHRPVENAVLMRRPEMLAKDETEAR